jgi:hypothetical protein
VPLWLSSDVTRGSLQRTRLNTALAYAEAEYKLERYDSKVSEAVAAIEGNGDDEKNAKPRTRRRRSWKMRVAYPLDRNSSRPIRAARATTSPHVQKWSSEAVLFIKSSLVANKTFCLSEL